MGAWEWSGRGAGAEAGAPEGRTGVVDTGGTSHAQVMALQGVGACWGRVGLHY